MSACGDSINTTEATSLDALVRTIAEEEELAIRDVSVPFERMAQASVQLQRMNQTIETGPDGVYVMRYTDDTLRHTLHVFVIKKTRRTYIMLSTRPYDDVSQQQYEVLASRYEEQTESLVLETNAGVVQLAPQDVTPVGA